MGFYTLLFIVGAGCVALVVFSIENAETKASEAAARLKLAKQSYEDSLRRLKENPTDPDLRQRALANGRVYSNLTRSGVGVTVYDELALSNDISAACAAASVATSDVASHDLPEARLARLAALRGKGLLSDEEYQSQRLVCRDYGRTGQASTRRRRMIAALSGSRSFSSNFRQVSLVNRSSLTRSIVSTIRIQHSTTTGGAGLFVVTISGPGYFGSRRCWR